MLVRWESRMGEVVRGIALSAAMRLEPSCEVTEAAVDKWGISTFCIGGKQITDMGLQWKARGGKTERAVGESDAAERATEVAAFQIWLAALGRLFYHREQEKNHLLSG